MIPSGREASIRLLPSNVGSTTAPLCLSQGLSQSYFPDTIGSLTVKEHLAGKLCNSFAVGSTINEFGVQGVENMVKYEIEWSVFDWCVKNASTIHEFTFTQEVIAVIDPVCGIGSDEDTSSSDTTSTSIVTKVMQKDQGEVVIKDQQRNQSVIEILVPELAEGPYNHSSQRISESSNGLQSIVTLYQNTPNPYAGQTVIGFKLPVASKATLSVYDVTGKVWKALEGEYKKGYNEVRLSSIDLGTTGVLYYQLDTEKYTATRKMIVME